MMLRELLLELMLLEHHPHRNYSLEQQVLLL
jgi:hypothetical protein